MRKRLQQTFAKKNAYKCTCELNQRDKKRRLVFTTKVFGKNKPPKSIEKYSNGQNSKRQLIKPKSHEIRYHHFCLAQSGRAADANSLHSGVMCRFDSCLGIFKDNTF